MEGCLLSAGAAFAASAGWLEGPPHGAAARGVEPVTEAAQFRVEAVGVEVLVVGAAVGCS